MERLRTGRAKAWSLAVTLSAPLLLAACGGGGGGDGKAAPSMVPTAPVSGKVLHADANTLRPIRDGAQYTYRGVDRPFGDMTAAPTIYWKTVTQSGTAGAEAAEHVETKYDDADPVAESYTLSASNGTIGRRIEVDLTGQGMVERIDLPELRSPVRLNDQYTVFERRIADAGVDFDGDGKRDSMDLAIYVLIAGEETVNVHNLRDAQAVKVNTFMKVRATYSGTGDYSPVVTTTETRWYVAGVGVVKASVAFDASEQIYNEELVTWDGVTSGIGASEPVIRDLPPPMSAVAFDEHAVVLTGVPGDPFGLGFRLSQLDPRGTVLASRDYPEQPFGYAPRGKGQTLVRLGERVLLVATSTGVGGIVMHSFDVTGQTMTAEPTRLTDDSIPYTVTDHNAMKAASDGSRLWVLWQNIAGLDEVDGLTPYGDVKLQSFDPNGVALREPIVLVSGVDASTLDDFALSVSSTRVIASWKQTVSDASTRQYVVVDQETSNPPVVRTLAPLTHAETVVKPLAFGSYLGLMWGDDTYLPYGVTLGTSFDPMLGSAASLDNAMIGPDWFPQREFPDIPSAYWLATAVDGNSVFTLTGHLARLWPEDSDAYTGFDMLVEWTPSAGPWSGASARLISHLPSTNGLFLPFPDHILVVTFELDRLQTIVVWRRP